MKNIFNQEVTEEIIERINKLENSTQSVWGKMTVGQMLAHCNVTYEMVYENKHSKPKAFMKFILKAMVKKTVVGETPYKHNSRTAPQFLMTDSKDFLNERQRLINFIKMTQEKGDRYFDGKESHSFGPLKKTEWNNMFYKHLDHHLCQFGV